MQVRRGCAKKPDEAQARAALENNRFFRTVGGTGSVFKSDQTIGSFSGTGLISQPAERQETRWV